jgi:hypothetical protein
VSFHHPDKSELHFNVVVTVDVPVEVALVVAVDDCDVVADDVTVVDAVVVAVVVAEDVAVAV